MMLNLTKVSGQCYGFYHSVRQNNLEKFNAWLSDSIINAAQILLKGEMFWLEVYTKCQLRAENSFEVKTGEFVQKIHHGEGNWHVVSTIGTQHPDVNVFDSMYRH